jgi:uncharacterized repeat protein (TIGR02543 family)
VKELSALDFGKSFYHSVMRIFVIGMVLFWSGNVSMAEAYCPWEEGEYDYINPYSDDGLSLCSGMSFSSKSNNIKWGNLENSTTIHPYVLTSEGYKIDYACWGNGEFTEFRYDGRKQSTNVGTLTIQSSPTEKVTGKPWMCNTYTVGGADIWWSQDSLWSPSIGTSDPKYIHVINCYSDTDCGSGSVCDKSAGLGNSSQWTCQVKPVISGNVSMNGVGLTGVVMSGLPGNPSTNTDGDYSTIVTYGWTGTVTPMKTGYTFTPQNRSYANVTTHVNQNYEAAGTPQILIKNDDIAIPHNGTYDFGEARTVTFTIENTGTADLNLTGTPIIHVELLLGDGSEGAPDYSVTKQPDSTLIQAGESVSFDITFTPGSYQADASVHIESNDPDDGVYTFDITSSQAVAAVKSHTDEAFAGGTVQINVNIQFQGVFDALGIIETIPAGWKFISVAGDDAPDIIPEPGSRETIEFAWKTPPSSPVDFSYSLQIPDGAIDEVPLDPGVVLFRQYGGGQESISTLPILDEILIVPMIEHSVSFVDHEGNVLKSESVPHGSSATAPEAPIREGYTFTGWDTAYDEVTGNLIITAQYTVAEYQVTYTSEDNGTVTGQTTQIVKHGETSTEVEAVADDGYHFVEWSDGSTANPRTDENVTEDIDVAAIFAMKDDQPTGQAYVISDQSGVNNIWKAQLTDDSITLGDQITDLQSPFYVSNMKIDETNRRIIYSYGETGKRIHHLKIIDFQGNLIRDITLMPEGFGASPAFDISPDGTEIVFAKGVEDQGLHQQEAYVVGTDNTGLRQIIETTQPRGVVTHKTGFLWLDDGRILFSNTRVWSDWAGEHDLHFYDDGMFSVWAGNTSSGEGNPILNPSRTKLAVRAMEYGSNGIHLADWPDGMQSTLIARSSTGYNPLFYRDDSTLIYASAGELYSIKTDGTDTRHLTESISASITAFYELRFQSGPATGWCYAQNDMAGTNHYVTPFPVQTADNLEEKFILPGTGGNILTGDVTGDGFLEIVHVSGNQLNIYNYQGVLLKNVTLGSSDCALTMIADINGDGIDDIGIGTNKTADLKTYFYDGNGTLLQTLSKTAGYDSYMRPAGLTGSGDVIISFTAGYSHDNKHRGFAVYDKSTGEEKWNYKVGPASWLSSIADFDNDGILEFTNTASTTHNGCTANGVDGNGTTTTDGDVWLIVVNENGNEIFSKKYPSPSDGSASHYFVDLNKDGQMQILGFESHGSSYYQGTSQVHLYDQTGTSVNTFNGQENSSWSFAVADMTGNGMDEVVAVSSIGDSHMLYILDTELTELDSLAVDGRVQLVSDINGDSTNEIVLLSNTGTITVLDNSLNVLNTYDVGTYGRVIASDISNNGKVSLICLTDGIHVLENGDEDSIPDQYTVVFKDHDGTVLKTEIVDHGSEAIPPSDPFREGFLFTGWDMVFGNVIDDLVVTAQYENVSYTVTYLAGDNGTISGGQALQTVNHGENTAEVAAVPNTGYYFVQWSDGISVNPRTDENVTDHLTVTAAFAIKQYTVIFLDHDSTVLKTESVEHENGATAPDDSVRAGYIFTGWDAAFDNVTGDLTVTAQYTRLTYTITYLAGNNGSITGQAQQTVNHGEDTTEVLAIPNTGHYFVQWSDGSTANPRADEKIIDNITITAEFASNQYTVNFLDHDGTVLKTETVEHGSGATTPPDPVRECYTFTGWDKDVSNVTENLEVIAEYTEINYAPRAFDSGSPFTVYTFTGLVDAIDDLENVFPPDVQVGDAMSGRFVYDASTSDDGNPGNYELDPQANDIHISVNSHVFGKVHHNIWLSILNDTSIWMEDTLQDGDQVNINASIENDHEFFWTLTGPTTVVENTELSDNLLDLAWTDIQFELYRIGGNFMQFSISDIEKMPNNPVVVQRDSSVQGTLVAVDTENDPLTYTIVSEPENGTLILDDPEDGTFTYTPDPGFTGDDSFTFKVNDGLSDSNTATVFITVQPPEEYTVTLHPGEHGNIEGANRGEDYVVEVEEGLGFPTVNVIPDVGYIFNGWDPPSPSTITADFEATAKYASIVVWGKNQYGQADVPNGLTDVSAIAAGLVHAVALLNDGTVVAWGHNDYGQTTVPDGLNNVTAIAAGMFHTVALLNDGTVVAWGDNSQGQSTVPDGLTNVVAIAAGDVNTVALLDDGTVVAWGSNSHGQATVPEGLTNVKAVSAGTYHTVALLNDGTVEAWGSNSHGQITVPEGLTNVKAVSAGAYHTVALLNDGTIEAWGEAWAGQANVLEVLTNVKAVSAGIYHTVALLNDGTVVAWGEDSASQATAVPDGLTKVKAIAAGGTHTVALLAPPPEAHTVRLNAGAHGIIIQANTGSDYMVSRMSGETFPNVDVVHDEGWIFIGWDTPLPDIVTEDFEATALYAPTEHILTVATTYGFATPATGLYVFSWGEELTASVTSPDVQGTTRHVCTGWTGTGSVPASGNSISTGAFTLTQDSGITWHWNTEYLLNTETAGNGSVDIIDSWHTAGSSVGITATADENHVFSGWSGDTDGCTIDGNQITVPMTLARSITAHFEIKQYTVAFLDHDGSTLKTETVNHGNAATPPPDPVRDGYTFTGWDPPLPDTITEELTVTAQYTIKIYNLTYTASGNGTLSGSASQTVNHGTNGAAVEVIPDEGYHFVQWSDESTANPRTDENVTGNINVSAQFAKNQYTVTFLDHDGTILKTETLDYGSGATPPSNPVREDYIFMGWDKDFSNVTENLEVVAQYTEFNTAPQAFGSIDSSLAIYRFSGLVDHIDNPASIFPAEIQVGDAMNGRLIYQPYAAYSSNPGQYFFDPYDPHGPVSASGIHISVNGHVFGKVNHDIWVSIYNDIPVWMEDSFQDGDQVNINASIENGLELIWTLTGPVTVLEDTELSDNLLDHAWTDIQFEIYGGIGGNHMKFSVNEIENDFVLMDQYDHLTVNQDDSIHGTLVAEDIENDPLTYIIVSGPENGTLTLNDHEAGTFTYTPDPGFSGGDHFTFKVNDGSLDSNTAVIEIFVLSNNVPEEYTVTLHPGKHGTIQEANSGEVYEDLVIVQDGQVIFPTVNVIPDPGYTFIGWNPSFPEIITADFEATALYESASVVVWGANFDGQTSVPNGLTDVSAIAAGFSHTIALLEDGTVKAWGDDYYGQSTVPEGLNNVKAIAGGIGHTVALLEDGSVVAWGDNGWHQQATVPDGLNNVTSIAAGYNHTVALLEDGTIVAWGANNYGPATVPDGLTSVTAIAAGGNRTVALLKDGTVEEWGEDHYGQSMVPEGLNNVKAIAAGGGHTVALLKDGTIVAWGTNIHGQTTVPDGLADVTSIAAGSAYTLALREDGTVVAWGDNIDGQTTIPDGLTSVKAIAAGGHHAVALIESKAPSVYTVRMNAGTKGSINQANTGSDYIVSLVSGETFPNVDVDPDDGWIFTGWDTPLPDTVTEDFEATALYAPVEHTLTVATPYGFATPAAGVYTFTWGEELTASVTSPDVHGTTRHVCTGWTGAGSVPVSGSGPITGIFTLTQDSSITWHWNTEYLLTTRTAGNGSVDAADSWHARGTIVVMTAASDENHLFTAWSGDIEGCTIDEDQITIPMTQARTVTAHFEIKTHTVTFLDHDGTELKSETVIHGSGATAPPEPEREGHTFKAWDKAFATITADLTVTARYERLTYQVTYNAGANGTITGPTPQIVPHGDSSEQVTAEPATGYHFVRWSDGLETNQRSDSNVTDTISVTAAFAINQYKVTVGSTEGGSTDKDGEHTIDHGGAITLSATPDEGYHFTGWSGAGTGTDNPLTVSDITADRTITATFEHNQYVVRFLDHDGTELKSETVLHGSGATSPEEPEREGYAFKGWDKAVASITADLLVTARYERLTYQVTYNAGDNGSINGPTSQTVLHGDSSEQVTAQPDTGYHFVQWDDGSEANPRSDSNVMDHISVTAKFAINQYKVTVGSSEGGSTDKDGEHTIDNGGSITLSATPDEGYHFTGWSGDASGTANPLTVSDITADRTITAGFERNQYTVTFLDHDGTVLKPETVIHGSGATAPPEPDREGHAFKGWDKAFANITADLTVTARYDRLTYQASYTAGDNGTITGPTPQTIPHGDSSEQVTAEPDTGYHFVQWDDGSEANPRSDSNVTDHISVTAAFGINQYKVTVGSTGGGSTDKDGEHTIEHGGAITFSATPEEGYHFTGWSGDASGTANPLTVSDITADRTITAGFERNEYTVTFLDHDGTELKSETVIHGSGATAPAEPEREGHAFKGWDKMFASITEDLTVTAQYDKLTFQVIYTAGDKGTITGPTPQTVPHGNSSETVTAEPETGYHFVQWDDGSTANPRTDENVTSDISVTAVFDYLKGDVNLDGKVTMKDAILLIQYAADQTELTEAQKKRGNISGHEDDNQVGMADAIRIFGIMAQSHSLEKQEN